MILTLIVYRKSDNLLKKKKKKSHHLVRAVLISHGNVFLSVKLCFNRKVFCSRKVSKFIIFKTKNSCGLLKVTIQLERIGQNGGKKNPIFFFFFLVLCVLLGNSLELRALIWSHLWDDIVFFVGRKVFCLNQLSRGLI